MGGAYTGSEAAGGHSTPRRLRKASNSTLAIECKGGIVYEATKGVVAYTGKTVQAAGVFTSMGTTDSY